MLTAVFLARLKTCNKNYNNTLNWIAKGAIDES
jgi:hypothetical protein